MAKSRVQNSDSTEGVFAALCDFKHMQKTWNLPQMGENIEEATKEAMYWASAAKLYNSLVPMQALRVLYHAAS